MKYAFVVLATLATLSDMAKTTGAVPEQPGWLGLGYTYNVTNTRTGRTVWLFVRQIAPKSPAERAGLKVQDVITGINGKQISYRDELETLHFFSGIHQGEHVQLQVSRGRTVQTVTVVADALPPEMAKRRQLNEEVAKRQRGQP